MSLDDRDYYREELARKRGLRARQPFGHRPASKTPPPKPSKPPPPPRATPLLDQIIDVNPPVHWGARLDDRKQADGHWPPEPPEPPDDGGIEYRPTLQKAAKRRRWMDRALLTMAATLALIVAALPQVITPRATYGASWHDLVERVAGNVHCTRFEGYVFFVHSRPCQ